MRKVIFHYHLFKNAGTSVDAVLKSNFPNQWVTKEFSGPHATNQAQVTEWIKQEKDAVVFSSHTAMLPPPQIEGVEIFPIIFLRHPIDRIASAYTFEHKQGADNYGSVVARNTSLSGYIEIHLFSGQNGQCRNFHVTRLAHMLQGTEGDLVDLALKTLDMLPFVGLVEEFDKSINRLSAWLSPHFPSFKPVLASKNVTRDNTLSLAQKIAIIRAEIGDDCHEMVLAANLDDMRLFEAALKKFLYLSVD